MKRKGERFWDELFISRLELVMSKRGLSQTDLAKRLHLPPSAINHWLSGRRLPSFHSIRRLIVETGTNAGWLLCAACSREDGP